MASNQSTCSPLVEPVALSPEKGSAGFGEIVVFIDGHTEAAGILEFAGVLASVVTESGRSQSGGRCPT